MVNLTILKMELNRSLKGLIGWSISIGVFMYIIVIFYPMAIDIYANMPSEYYEVLAIFGGIPTNEIEYFASEGGMLLQICGAIYAVLLGFSSISREERDHTSDMIYSLPVNRVKFFYTKLLSVIIQTVIFTIFVSASTILGFLTVDSTINVNSFIIFMLLFMVMMIIISIIGFSLAAILKSNSKSSVALIIPLPLYIISIIATLTKNELLQKIKYLTPFTFSDPISYLKKGDSVEFISLTIFTLISLGLIVYSTYIFNKKEFLN